MTSPVRLTSLTLRNFKAIGETTQTITFAPITLLFGPNSAGKSTILHALHYAREILCHRNLDPHQILDGDLDLGGFRSLVHDHDQARTVTLGLAFEIVYSPQPSWLNRANAEAFVPILDRLETCAVWIDVRFSEEQTRAYVARYSVMLNGQPVGTIEAAPDGGGAKVTSLNHRHPVLFDATAKCWSNYAEEVIEAELDLWFGWQPPAPPQSCDSGDGGVPRIGPTAEERVLKPIDVLTEDALPPLDEPLDIEPNPQAEEFYHQISDYAREGLPLSSGWSHAEHRIIFDPLARARNIVNIFTLVASIGLVWPAELLRRGLTEMLHIGPIREIPPRSSGGRPLLENARWMDGLAAWDVLANAEEDFIARVNGWLAGRLNSGYTVRLAKYRELPVDSPATRMLESGELPEDADAIWAEIAALPVLPRVYLRREGSATDLLPADLGVGLSQLLPIVVAALHAKGTLIVIEQPELHNHPAIQVALGDLFIEAAFPRLPDLSEEVNEEMSRWAQERGVAPKRLEFFKEAVAVGIAKDREARRVFLLVETHSEHLILRLLRRIRETADGELPPGSPALKPDDIAVHYVEPAADGVRIQRLRVNDKGDFLDRWPRGFFEERVDELF